MRLRHGRELALVLLGRSIRALAHALQVRLAPLFRLVTLPLRRRIVLLEQARTLALGCAALLQQARGMCSLHLPSSAQLGSVLGSWGKTMRDAVKNKESWKRRRTPTQDPSTYRGKFQRGVAARLV